MRTLLLPCLLAGAAASQGPATGDLLVFTGALEIGLDGVELGGICAMRPDGTDFRRLTSFESIGLIWEPHSFDLPDDHPDLSRDGRKIAFTRRVGLQDWDLYLMDVNGSNQTRLTTSPGLDIQPVFSPDGTRLAFASARAGQLDIFVLNLATGAQTRLTTNGLDELEPAWSPDGTKIAFTRVFARGEKDVFVMNADGGNQRQLTFAPGEDHDPKFSPDGLRLAFTSERDFSVPRGDTWTMDAATGANAVNLTDDIPFGCGDPAWSPDGTKIVFFRCVLPVITGPQRMVVMDRNGANKRELPMHGLLNLHPNWSVLRDSDLDGRPDHMENSNRAHTGRDFLSLQGGAHFGQAIAFPDLTRDGFLDVAVGAPDHDVLSAPGAGIVLLGRGSALGLDIGLLGASGVSLINRRVDARTFGAALTPSGRFGATLVAGDFNGDGHRDLAIGAPGQNQVFVMLSPSGPHVTLSGTGGFGSALAAADFDGDGRDDLAVGAPTALRNGGQGNVAAGQVVVFRGTATGMSLLQTIAQNSLPDPNAVGGPEAGDAFGAALAAGNVNGDGFDDLVIGAPGEGYAGVAAAGVVYVVPGAPGAPLAVGSAVQRETSTLPAPFAGPTANARFGEVLALGDFNRDIFRVHDVVVGVPRQRVGAANEAGMVVVIPGALGLATTVATVFTATSLGGTPQAGARFGQCLATGSFDGDSVADLAIAAPRESVGSATLAGRVYVVHGARATNTGCSFCGPIISLSGGGLLAASAVAFDASQVGLSATTGAHFGGTSVPGLANCLAAADFDGDGQDDLAIGVPHMTAIGEAAAGQVAVRFGIGVGTFVLEPPHAIVDEHRFETLGVVWTHPEQWRVMATMDVRLATDEGIFFWVRIDPEGNTIRLYDAACDEWGATHALGRGGVLGNRWAQVRLRDSRVAGSGPEGRDVVLELSLRFQPMAKGRTFRVELSGTDDAGHAQRFEAAGSRRVVHRH